MSSTEEIWKYINKKRGKRKYIENKIHKEEWERYFKTLLGEKEETGKEEEKEKEPYEEKTRKEGEKERIISEEEEKEREELEDNKILQVIRKMEKKKAAGVDDIPMEAWIHGGTDGGTGSEEILYGIYERGIEERRDT